MQYDAHFSNNPNIYRRKMQVITKQNTTPIPVAYLPVISHHIIKFLSHVLVIFTFSNRIILICIVDILPDDDMATNRFIIEHAIE